MKITMYELLGLVKDGKAPNKIRYRYSCLYKDFKFDGETLNYISDKDWLFGENITSMLNDKVEIIEEEKKIPEKIKDKYCSQISKVELAQKYNEIINYLDYLKSKGE